MRIVKKQCIKLVILFTGLLMMFPVFPALADGDPPNSNPTGEIMRGYRPTQYKHVTGYHLEHFGFFGGEFSRMVKEYEYLPCCTPTRDNISGCSAPVVCPGKH